MKVGMAVVETYNKLRSLVGLVTETELKIVSLRESCAAITPEEFWTTRESGYCQLVPPGKVDRKKAHNIISHDNGPPFGALSEIFKNTSYFSTPFEVARLNDVYADGLRGVCVTKQGLMIHESSWIARAIDPKLSHVPFVSMDLKRFYKNYYRTIYEPVLHCIHPAAGAFGHFLLDVLPTVALFRSRLLSGEMKLLVPWVPDWAFKLFQVFGIEDKHMIKLNNESAILKNVTISGAMTTGNTYWPNPNLVEGVRKSIRSVSSVGWERTTSGDRIYVSRKNQTNFSNRDIENETELRDLLEKFKFKVVEPSKLPFQEQIDLFSKASIVIGPHGSGFGNLIWGRPNTTVIDLMPDDWVGFYKELGKQERWVLNVTTLLKMNYTVLLCKSQIVNQESGNRVEATRKPSMTSVVDLKLLQEILERTLAD